MLTFFVTTKLHTADIWPTTQSIFQAANLSDSVIQSSSEKACSSRRHIVATLPHLYRRGCQSGKRKWENDICIPGVACAARAALVLESRASTLKFPWSVSGVGQRGWNVGPSGMWTSLRACWIPLFLHILLRIQEPRIDSKSQTANTSTHPRRIGDLQYKMQHYHRPNAGNLLDCLGLVCFRILLLLLTSLIVSFIGW